MQQQLLLDLGSSAAPDFESFVTGRNAEVLSVLSTALAGAGRQRQIHLWGESGSGKSHLLAAYARARGGRYLSCRVAPAVHLAFEEAVPAWAIDDVDAADGDRQRALFNLVNEIRAQGHVTLLTASAAAPRTLAVRDDLRTRIEAGLVLRLESLNDVERDAALLRHADSRGLALSAEVRQYLLTHFQRDMPSLMRLIDALDRYGLEKQRPLTIPLIRQWLKEASEHAS